MRHLAFMRDQSILRTTWPRTLFGWWAEGLIMLNYLKKTTAVPSVTDWFDILAKVPGLPDPSPMKNPIAFFNFLQLLPTRSWPRGG